MITTGPPGPTIRVVNPLRLYIAILVQCGALQKQSKVAMMATIALAFFSRYKSLCIASSGLEYVLECQGKFSLHYAATYELIFELHQPQQLTEKAHEDKDSKGHTTTMLSYKY